MHNRKKSIKIGKILILGLSLVFNSCADGYNNKNCKKALKLIENLIKIYDTDLKQEINFEEKQNKFLDIKIFPNTDIQYIKQKTLDNNCGLCCAYNVLLRYKSKFEKKLKLPEYSEFLIYDVSSVNLYLDVFKKYNRIKPNILPENLRKLNIILGQNVSKITDKFIDNKLEKIIKLKKKQLCNILELKESDTTDMTINMVIENLRDGFTKSSEKLIGGIKFATVSDIIKKFNYKEQISSIDKNNYFQFYKKNLYDLIKSRLCEAFNNAIFKKKLIYAQDLIELGGGISTYGHVQTLLQNYDLHTEKLLNYKIDQNKILKDPKWFAIITSSGRHIVTFIRVDKNKWQKIDGYSDKTDFNTMKIEEIFNSCYAKNNSQAIIIKKK